MIWVQPEALTAADLVYSVITLISLQSSNVCKTCLINPLEAVPEGKNALEEGEEAFSHQ